jgi:hypothetical protein
LLVLFVGRVAKPVFRPHRADFFRRSNVTAFDLGLRLGKVCVFVRRQLDGGLRDIRRTIAQQKGPGKTGAFGIADTEPDQRE